MTIPELIAALQQSLDHGAPPETLVVVHDPLTQLYLEGVGLTFVSARETTTVPVLKIHCAEAVPGLPRARTRKEA